MTARTWGGPAPPVSVDSVWNEMADDEALAQRAKSDPTAFAPLYRRYVRPIYGYCFRRLAGREAAEDATSQIFIKALAAIPNYRGNAFRPWLYTIAHHVVVDHYRRQKPAGPLDDALEIASNDLSPEAIALHRDDERSVRNLLVQLTPDQRDVVELRLSGLTGVEIADALGKQPGAVRAVQFRAYQRLRELLNEEGGRS